MKFTRTANSPAPEGREEKAIRDARARKAFREEARGEGYRYAVIPGTWAGEHLDRIGSKKDIAFVKQWADTEVEEERADWVEVRDAQSWELLYVVSNENQKR
jgi:hypothetical protein